MARRMDPDSGFRGCRMIVKGRRQQHGAHHMNHEMKVMQTGSGAPVEQQTECRLRHRYTTKATMMTPSMVQTSELTSMRTRSLYSDCGKPSALQANVPGKRNGRASASPIEEAPDIAFLLILIQEPPYAVGQLKAIL